MKTDKFILTHYFAGAGKRLLMLAAMAFFSCTARSQSNINGIWDGLYLTASSDLGQPKLVLEIYNLKDSSFTGVTHLYYDGNKYEHYKINGWYDKKDSIILFKEVATIAVDLGLYSNCLGAYTMVLKKEKKRLYQYGYWEPNIKGCTLGSGIWLQKRVEDVKQVPVSEKKVADKKPVTPSLKPLKGKIAEPVMPVTPTEPVAKNIPAVKNAPVILPAKVAQRETDVQSLIEIAATEKDSIKVDVYDNGEIDGDSVSVYEENIPRVNKKMITANPITFYVTLNKNENPIVHLRMVAESLGSIPPCTALMIVTTKTKRYELHLSSNFNKNATVELFLKE